MHSASSAICTCSARLSTSENTATLLIPISRSARITRTEISPRLATRIFRNTITLYQTALLVVAGAKLREMGTVAETAALEVIHPTGEHTHIPIDPLPFRIGRGPNNNLIIRDNRASRSHAVIKNTPNGFAIEDLDSLRGTWVNGNRISEPTVLLPSHTVHFGFEDTYRLLFSDNEDRLDQLLNRLSELESQPGGTAGQFARLRAGLDVARVMQTSLAMDQVLGAVLDTALTLTGAERAFLIL